MLYKSPGRSCLPQNKVEANQQLQKLFYEFHVYSAVCLCCIHAHTHNKDQDDISPTCLEPGIVGVSSTGQISQCGIDPIWLVFSISKLSLKSSRVTSFILGLQPCQFDPMFPVTNWSSCNLAQMCFIYSASLTERFCNFWPLFLSFAFE